MPKHDGRGPKGSGPMTGKGRGSCILKIPNTPGEPVTGFVGESGRPVRFFLDKSRLDMRLTELEDCPFVFRKCGE